MHIRLQSQLKLHVIPALFAEQICFTPRSSSRTERLSPPQFFSSDCFKGTTICKSVWGRQNTSPYPLTVLLENLLLWLPSPWIFQNILNWSIFISLLQSMLFPEKWWSSKKGKEAFNGSETSINTWYPVRTDDSATLPCNKSCGWIISPLR